jgi:type II secretory pathway predicted ATPase ExeA
VYVGQTGGVFKTRYKEHINDIRQNVEKSRYAIHMLKENHEYGPIEKVMNVLKVENKGKQLDVNERFYIYKATQQKYVMNEQHADVNNVLFYLIIDCDKTARM